MPELTRITVYPVKSLDGRDVDEATVLPSGALEHDRRFALVDEAGEFFNAKRSPRFHTIRSSYDPAGRSLTLVRAGDAAPRTFAIDGDREALQAWLSEALDLPVRLFENPGAGFPDDTRSPGPTFLGAGTLEEVARWFPGLDADDVRRRFRANLLVGGCEPFWEDRLVAAKDRVVRFRVGAIVFEGTNPCERCPVPARSPSTGDRWPDFQKTFANRRRDTLPSWAEPTRFDHFYRLAVNTRPAGEGGRVRVGDPVEILGVSGE